MEAKVVNYKVDGTVLVVTVDPNKDGTAVIEIKIPIMEVFNEILGAVKK